MQRRHSTDFLSQVGHRIGKEPPVDQRHFRESLDANRIGAR